MHLSPISSVDVSIYTLPVSLLSSLHGEADFSGADPMGSTALGFQ